MDRDDLPVGRLLTRRQAIALLGVSGAAFLVGSAPDRRGRSANAPLPPGCVVRPEQTEGPYFVDEKLNRSDIRSDPANGVISAGVPLALAFAVSQVSQGSCRPLAGAQVDVWHCDALGVYSDVTDPHFTTVGKKHLRGYQVTDAAGLVKFRTIYPGWYEGRAVHIHFKIRTAPVGGRRHQFTSQVYFDDAFSDRVYAAEPYASKGPHGTLNRDDQFFPDGGEQLILNPTAAGDGYGGTFAIGLQLG